MKLYRTGYSEKIDEVESERQTEHSVFINGNRSAWKTAYTCHFKTRNEAKDHILHEINLKLSQAKSQVNYLSEKLKKALEL